MKKPILFSLLIGVLLLSACSLPANIPFLSKATATVNPAAQFDPGAMPVEQKLGFGILELEGTANAVTAEQAQALLPLWQALKGLSANANTTDTEINALYEQMRDALNPAQVTAIEQMSWNQADLQTLAQTYGLQFPQAGGPNGSGARGTPSPERATQMAQRQQSGQTGQGGFGGGGGGFDGPPSTGSGA